MCGMSYIRKFRCVDRNHHLDILKMSCTNYLQPHLPLELERMIFELAVSTNGTNTSTPLLFVAKRVREW